MKITNEFTVHTPIDKAWAVLTDLEGIAPCLPGAQLTGVDGDVYSGKVKVKVGPVISDFAGTARFVEKDDTAHRAVIDAKGRDSRSAGNAAALITAQLRPSGDATVVSVDTDLKISGKLAQFGSGMIKEVSGKLLGQFVAALEAKIGASPAGTDLPGTASGADLSGAASAGADLPKAASGADLSGAGAADSGGGGAVGGDDVDTSIALESPGGAATAFATDVRPGVPATPQVGGPAAGVDAGTGTAGTSRDADSAGTSGDAGTRTASKTGDAGTAGTSSDAGTAGKTGDAGAAANRGAAADTAGAGTPAGSRTSGTDAPLGADIPAGVGTRLGADLPAGTRLGADSPADTAAGAGADVALGAGRASGAGVETTASVAAPIRIGGQGKGDPAQAPAEPEPLDLMELAGGSIRKRIAPVAIGVAVVIAAAVVVIRIARR